MNDYVYDLETYPNIFTMAVEHVETGFTWAFEISDWRNDSRLIIEFVHYLKDTGARMIGYNNLGFDYPILHMICKMGNCDAVTIYAKAQAIITSQDDNRWQHMVYESDRMVPQIDLFKIHHFDNKAKGTSLKSIEFNMRAESIQDLPYKVGSTLTLDQVPTLKRYNAHDVTMTKRFYFETLPMIKFREELTKKYDRDFMNHNDTKIGKDYFIMELEKAGVQCYEYGKSGRTPKQTPRPTIALKDAILPWIKFEQPEFTRILNWFKDQTITETKGVFKDVTATVAGFTFVFGLGGIHGSIESEVVESDETHVLCDLDVSSYYPNLAIMNEFYPEHLTKTFCTIYKDLYEQRKSYAKGTAENAMLKLALNGTYGDSNQKFSVFYDPLFTMSITLNGQLLLCLLAQELLKIPDIRLIQINTDGLTVRIPRNQKHHLEFVRETWQQMTGLQLEEAIYSKMFVRDVNNYIGLYENGKVKRKGAYEHDVEWHQNAGGLVIAKVAEMVLVNDAPIRKTLEGWTDLYDFILRTKVPRSGYLQWGEGQVQNITRYIVTTDGKKLTKWLPPLKGKTEWRAFAIEAGRKVQVCNDVRDTENISIDYSYYINEIEKLTTRLA